MGFGIKLREERKRQKLTQTELGQKINVGRSSIGNWETGIIRPSISKIFDIVNALAVNPFELIGDYTIEDIENLKKKPESELNYEDTLAIEFSRKVLANIEINDNNRADMIKVSFMRLADKIYKNEKTADILSNALLYGGGKNLLIQYHCLNEYGKKFLFNYLSDMLRFPEYTNICSEVEKNLQSRN